MDEYCDEDKDVILDMSNGDAAPELAEPALHNKQQPQDNICLCCKGDGCDPVQNGGLTRVCRICGGNGKRSSMR